MMISINVIPLSRAVARAPANGRLRMLCRLVMSYLLAHGSKHNFEPIFGGVRAAAGAAARPFRDAFVQKFGRPAMLPYMVGIAKKVLVVDDDAGIREMLRFALEKAGFAVAEAGDGRAALAAFAAATPDLVVLDILMPEIEGTEVCRRLRRDSRVPIIFISSCDEDTDRIVGLELGGDDYVTKPFSPRELVARVKAVLRRAEPPVAPDGAARPSASDADDAKRILVAGRLRLDPNVFKAFWDAHEVVLTATEFALLAALMRHPGRVYSRAELMARTYEDDLVVTDRTIDSHVRRVRGKFAAAGADPIETVHGVGYKLAPCR
jgi:two-component system OmpR family response regulator